jgi:hypothetical protein
MMIFKAIAAAEPKPASRCAELGLSLCVAPRSLKRDPVSMGGGSLSARFLSWLPALRPGLTAA